MTLEPWRFIEPGMRRRRGLQSERVWFLLGVFVGVALGMFVVWASPAWAGEEFGIATFESQFAEGGGTTVQAGSHPSAFMASLVFNNHPTNSVTPPYVLLDGREPKNVEANLPAGVIINPTATVTRCSDTELEETGGCPASSQVGVDRWDLGFLASGVEESPVYNMETNPNEPAEFGFSLNQVILGFVIHITGKVRTGSDYGLTGEVPEIRQNVEFFSNTIEFWGSGHGLARPLITLPTSCGGDLTTTVSADSWQEPFAPPVDASATSNGGEGYPATVTGCQNLSFNPQLSVQVTSHEADSPTGLRTEITVPQEEVGGLVQANLKEAIVTLPAGMSVSPSAADGDLGACTPAQIGLGNSTSASCPESAKVGSLEIETPLLEVPLKGSVYLAQQGINAFPQEPSNPFKSLIALYLVAEAKGVVIKVPGEVRLNPATGQLTADFGKDPVRTAVTGEPQFLPQLPFTHLAVEFFGGPRAALVTPSTCGSYTVTSQLAPYSAPESGPPATPDSSFEIDERCGGGQFNPSFNAGTTNNQAGAFSPFVLTGFREDTEQNVSRLQVRTPPGLVGTLTGIPLCREPTAEEGKCGQGSLIGHVTVGVGAGPDPLYVNGEAFLTGPYNGAPFGLSVVVPAVAGPFNLGTVVVRAAVDIDPNTAGLTVTSDPLPQILDGIPLQVRVVHVGIDREHFMFNPTNCDPLSITASLTSVQSASASLSQTLQATNCAALAFKPKFTLSTSGRTSRTNGASLDAKVSLPSGSLGTEANFASVKVELPKQLPARLTTLRKACLSGVFEADPASCPAASVVGVVRASTPILPVQLTGPVYFVSHGGEAYPSLVVVLQGYGVRVDLTAATFIAKKTNITSSTFKSLPDVPVSSFELYLPEGPYSALATDGSLCKGKLAMPTVFTAQNGMEIHQSTPIAVTGCPKSKVKAKTGRAHRAAADHSDTRSHQ